MTKQDVLIKALDCSKPADEQMFGCFTQHYFLHRSDAGAESTAASYESGTTRLDPYYDRRQSWPIQPLLSLLKQENFISCGREIVFKCLA